ncbi:ribosomal-protein-serine acetyltransferase [Kroppenstedtia guangzhouensis]|uniref:Ribosomal-protein-serine acetyltransferase n=1 Tax=Kroppenstedtia guangzhouensis TaxID=1274356 RepID=A0ABQ1GGH5_9BACL|nr:GNAT family protein [Kroppenstedtia guangzhouensis]GGA43162.1 ribosomal-protein-serine acetyltransferase [Kroppenstedtia guangzhouensis]
MFAQRVRDEVSLRWLEPHHGEALFRLIDASREHLRPWFPWVNSTREPKDTEEFIRGALRGVAEGREAHFGIWVDGQIAGVTGAHTIHRLNRHAEIGYWLGQDFEGKGMMTASVGVLLDYLVEEREIHRIEARCAAGNDRSRRVMERLGMRREGVLREGECLADGTCDDTLIYGILASEWKGRRGAR